jgi:electron-transferring-flavoprotein dehydrogenase
MVTGVATNDLGIAKDGTKRETFQPGVELRGK